MLHCNLVVEVTLVLRPTPINESPAKVAEYGRLALRLASSHNCLISPESYHVWYAYASGSDAKLCAHIDAEMERRSITQDFINACFKRFIMPDPGEELKQTKAELNGLIEDLFQHIKEAGAKSENSECILAKYVQDLEGSPDVSQLRSIVSSVMGEVKRVRSAEAQTQKHLRETHEEMAQLKDKLNNVKEQSLLDSLTGIPNRRAFDLTLNDLMLESREQSQPLSLLLIDIDHFKSVNDTHGHLIGDQVLRYMAKTLKNNLKGRALIARYGGEEFAAILPETELPSALEVAETMRASVYAGSLVKRDTNQRIGRVTVSIGASQLRPNDTGDRLIRRADQAMYRAKQGGRNQVMAEMMQYPTE